MQREIAQPTHVFRRGDRWVKRWSPDLLTIPPTLVAAYSERLLTLEVSHRVVFHADIQAPPVHVSEALTAVLLSCRALRDENQMHVLGSELVEGERLPG